MADTQQVITLLDEKGREHRFEVVDVVEVEGREYVVLLSLEADADDDAAVVFRVEDDTLVTIEDDQEFARVVAALEDDQDQEDDAPQQPQEH